MNGKHNLIAEWNPDTGVVVHGPDGKQVEVEFAGTEDNRTCYAYTKDGIIGGWQYPSPALPFKALVAAINRGVLYTRFEDLPKLGEPGSRRKERLQ